MSCLMAEEPSKCLSKCEFCHSLFSIFVNLINDGTKKFPSHIFGFSLSVGEETHEGLKFKFVVDCGKTKKSFDNGNKSASKSVEIRKLRHSNQMVGNLSQIGCDFCCLFR